MGKTNNKSMSTSWMGRCLIFSLLTLKLADCTWTLPRNGTANTSKSLVEYLTTEYDKTVRPNFGSGEKLPFIVIEGKPTEVFLDLYVETFGNIKEVNMEFPVFLYFRQMWYDDRIADYVNSTVSLQRKEIMYLWSPDTFCYNAKKSDLMLPNTEVHSVLRIEPDGLVFYSRSSQIVASCEMDLHDFPMDTQFCKLTFGSYGYRDKDILMIWRNSTIDIGNKEMAQFSVGDASLSTKTNRYVGNFTSLTVTFPFKRRMGYYVIQVYIPCVFLVMLSWIVFWMRPDDSASRLTVGITTILTIVFLLGYTNGMLPKVSYVKGMDWYLMVCFTIIFLSLLECIVVDRLWRASTEKTPSEEEARKKKHSTRSEKCLMKNRNGLNFRYVSGVQILRSKKTDTATQTSNNGDWWNDNDQEQTYDKTQEKYEHLSLEQMEQRPLSQETWSENDKENMHYDTVVRCFVKRNSCPMELSAKVDKASRVLFPLSFVVYNIAYWLTYYYGIRILPKRI